MRDVLSWVGRPHGARAAAVTKVLQIGQARWNTPDGGRPGPDEAAAMTDPVHGRKPWIYTPLEVEVVRILKGSVTQRMTVFAAAGRIGKDATGGCTFTLRDNRLAIREGPEKVEVGGTYVSIFGNEMLSGAEIGPLRMPVVDQLFSVHYDSVTGFDGKPEPLPY